MARRPISPSSASRGAQGLSPCVMRRKPASTPSAATRACRSAGSEASFSRFCPFRAISIRFSLSLGAPSSTPASSRRLRALGNGPFIFNLGHGIQPDTPIAHVERLIRLVKDASDLSNAGNFDAPRLYQSLPHHRHHRLDGRSALSSPPLRLSRAKQDGLRAIRDLQGDGAEAAQIHHHSGNAGESGSLVLLSPFPASSIGPRTAGSTPSFSSSSCSPPIMALLAKWTQGLCLGSQHALGAFLSHCQRSPDPAHDLDRDPRRRPPVLEARQNCSARRRGLL